MPKAKAKTRREVLESFQIMDDWFDGHPAKSVEVLHQVKGAHAAMAWMLGIEIVGSHSFEQNLEALKSETTPRKDNA